MWNQGGFGGNQGGFLNTSSQFSPGGTPGEKKTVKRAQNLVPVTIQQILESPEDGFKIADVDVHMVTIVGVVKSVETDSTKTTYRISDTSGAITATHWLEGQETGDPRIIENTYCRIIGSLRYQQGMKYIMIFKITPLQDLNELTTHILEVIYCNLKMEQIQQKQSQSMSMNAGGDVNLTNSLVGANIGDGGSGFGLGGSADGLTQPQQLVYRTLQSCTSDVGLHKEQLFTSLRGKLGQREIESILEFLSGEGHIYSTVDEDHFKTTDSS